MTLTFKVAKLKEAAQAAVKLHESARDQYEVNLATYRREDHDRWHEQHREGVERLRDYLSRCIKSNIPPDHATARKALGKSDLTLYSPVSKNTSMVEYPPGYPNPRIGTIRAMVSFLDFVDAETITASQLKVVGFEDLASLYREAVGSLMAETNIGDSKGESDMPSIEASYASHEWVKEIAREHDNLIEVMDQQALNITALFRCIYILFACCVVLGVGLLAVM